RSTGSASSRSATTTSTASPTSPTRAARSWAAPRPTTPTSWSSATWTWTCWRRSGTSGSSTATGARTPTVPWSSRKEGPVKTLIRGGTVVTAPGTFPADVLVDGETIAALLDPAHTESLAGTADPVLDAGGLYVMPGGIDVHTHMEMPFGGTFSVDDFETGTQAAAWGGT